MMNFLYGLLAAAAISLVVLASGTARAEPVNSPAEAARLLQQSVVSMDKGSNKFCTATKVAPFKFLTAKHCTQAGEFSFQFEPKFEVAWPKWITVPVGEKMDNTREYDWAVVTSYVDMEYVTAAEVGCGEELYLGQPVATFGYSSRTQPSFSVGYVASLKPGTRPNNYDFAIDVQVAPGSSGSPILSMDTGKIIGVLIEGVFDSRAGAYLIGVQDVNDTELCADKE